MGLREIKSGLENNVLTYVGIGTIPGKFQERIAEKMGRKNTFYSWYALGAVGAYFCLKYLIGESLDGSYEKTAHTLKLWAEFGLGVNLVRTGLIVYRNKPYGDLFGEAFYLLFRKASKKTRKVLEKESMEELLEDTNPEGNRKF